MEVTWGLHGANKVGGASTEILIREFLRTQQSTCELVHCRGERVVSSWPNEAVLS